MSRAKKSIDPEEVRKCAALGGTIPEIAKFVGCGHATIERRFMDQVHVGRAQGILRVKGVVYRKALDGNMTAAQFYLANMAGWVLKPEVSVVTNVTQHAAAAGELVITPERQEALYKTMKALRERIDARIADERRAAENGQEG